jgi:nucleotide-binding universal stress UspA family protein
MSTGGVTVRGGQVRPDFQFRRILVLTDFSRGAKSALDCARLIARRFNSKLLLLHVIPSALFQYISPDTRTDGLESAREFADREMHTLLNDSSLQGLQREGLIAEGAIWPIISETIESREIDLITVATHSGHSEKNLLLGSTADQVYRMVDCPILTVPPEFSSRPNVKLQRLLFATKFMPHNERAADVAHSLECGPDGQLTVLHVVEEASESPLQSHKIVKDFLVKRMRKDLPDTCTNVCKPQFEVRFGKPADEILSASQQFNSELILLGLRNKQRAAGHLPSAVAYSIVCQSNCPVLTFHQK